MAPQNKSLFSFEYKGLAWKLLIDPSSSVLVTEWRDEESREADFSAIDLVQKKELWSGLERKEKWWTGLEEAKNGWVLLHGYKDLQNPEHKGISVYEIKSGKLVWTNEDYSFLSLEEEHLVVYIPEDKARLYKKLRLKDGALIGEMSEMELVYHLEEKAETSTGILNSNHYTAENRYFEKISGFIEAFTGKRASEAVDYLEFNEKIIVSFYVKEGEKLVNYLLVVNGLGEILYQETIGAEISGIGLETFFLYKDLLIFVKNKKELLIFEL